MDTTPIPRETPIPVDDIADEYASIPEGMRSLISSVVRDGKQFGEMEAIAGRVDSKGHVRLDLFCSGRSGLALIVFIVTRLKDEFGSTWRDTLVEQIQQQ